jgi:hypothetical protein
MTSAALLLVLSAADVQAEVEPPRNAVSVEVLGFLWSGVEIDGERFLNRHVSLQLALGARVADRADFTSVTLGVGTGARFWLDRLKLFSDVGGPFLGARLDGAWTHTRTDSGSAAASVRVGYRFVVLRHVEITPEAGFALSFGIDPAPWLVVVPRPGAVFGLTLGWLF